MIGYRDERGSGNATNARVSVGPEPEVFGVSPVDAGTATLPALDRTIRGTGGALAGSMLTTVAGMGVLMLAITPILGQFGLLLSLSILYAYLASVLVLPSVLVVWARVT